MTESMPRANAGGGMLRATAYLLLIVSVASILGDPGMSATRAGTVPVADAAPKTGSRPRFADVTAKVGVPLTTTQSWGATFVDFAGGRLPDVFVNRHTHRPDRLLNQHGTLTAMSDQWQRPMDRHTCGWGEANGDGALDLLCLQGGQRSNELWVTGTDILEESAATFGLDAQGVRGRGLNWVDYDRDGDLDVLLTAVGFTRLFRNDRGTFKPVEMGVEVAGTAVGSTWTDWNGDGWPDLLLVRTKEKILALQNDGGQFSAVRLRGVPAQIWNSALFADFNGDGRQDLHLVRQSRSLLLRKVGDGRFKTIKDGLVRRARTSVALDADNDGRLDIYLVRSAIGSDPNGTHDYSDQLLVQRDDGSFRTVGLAVTSGWEGSGDGVAAADFDGDGGMDVMVTNGWVRWRGRAVLLRNRMPRGNWTRIRLDGTRWNPVGFGARITVRADGDVSKRLLTDRIVWRSQSDLANVHLGIGDATRARVTVRWPNGVRDCVMVRAGRTMTVRIGESPCG